jgi:hypothetical protein
MWAPGRQVVEEDEVASGYLRTPTISWLSFFDFSDRNDFENDGKMMGVLKILVSGSAVI